MEHLSRNLAENNAWFAYQEQIGMEFFEFVNAYSRRRISDAKFERGGQALQNLLCHVGRADLADLVIDTNDTWEMETVPVEIWDLLQTNWVDRERCIHGTLLTDLYVGVACRKEEI